MVKRIITISREFGSGGRFIGEEVAKKLGIAYVGRTYRDAPNVDGLIFINTDVELISGDFAKVKVTGALDYDLIGELM